MSRVYASRTARAKPQAWPNMCGWASRGRDATALFSQGQIYHGTVQRLPLLADKERAAGRCRPCPATPLFPYRPMLPFGPIVRFSPVDRLVESCPCRTPRKPLVTGQEAFALSTKCLILSIGSRAGGLIGPQSIECYPSCPSVWGGTSDMAPRRYLRRTQT
jgi:hypothetical protein